MTTITKPAPYVRDVPCHECEGEGSYTCDIGYGDSFRAETRTCEECGGKGIVAESSHGVGDCWVPAGKDAADWQPLDKWLTTADGIGVYAVTFADKHIGVRGSVVGEAQWDGKFVVVGDFFDGTHLPPENVTSVTCVGTVQL